MLFFCIIIIILESIYIGGYIMETIQKILLVVTIIGAVNWGLIGLFDINLVATIFGSQSILSKIVYSLVGICGLVLLSSCHSP